MLPELQQLTWLFEALPSGVLIVSAEGDILKINSRARTFLALPLMPEYPHLDALPAYLAPLCQRLLSARQDVPRGEVVVTLPGAEAPTTVGFRLKVITPGPEDTSLSQLPVALPLKAFVFTDITQIQRDRQSYDMLQQELFQSKKLAAIGTLVSGVAHELNNPLTGISMSTSLARMLLGQLQTQVPETSQPLLTGLQEEIDKITNGCLKASAIVSELLDYARPTQLKLTPEDIIAQLQAMLDPLQTHPAFSQMSLHLRLPQPAEPVYVLCDWMRLEQVFYNLLKNASDAMGARGNLYISVEADQAEVRVRVQDEGPGIDPTVLGRIFDPFFTTKGAKGVGLGLSLSFRTLEQHGGKMSVVSHAGPGACFLLQLPRHVYDTTKEDTASVGALAVAPEYR